MPRSTAATDPATAIVSGGATGTLTRAEASESFLVLAPPQVGRLSFPAASATADACVSARERAGSFLESARPRPSPKPTRAFSANDARVSL
jgi:hypothetical protein